MATTNENYQIEIALADGKWTPSAVGKALYDAMTGMPDEPFDYEFDSFHQGPGAEQRTLDIPLQFEDPNGERHNVGMAYITKVS